MAKKIFKPRVTVRRGSAVRRISQAAKPRPGVSKPRPRPGVSQVSKPRPRPGVSKPRPRPGVSQVSRPLPHSTSVTQTVAQTSPIQSSIQNRSFPGFHPSEPSSGTQMVPYNDPMVEPQLPPEVQRSGFPEVSNQELDEIEARADEVAGEVTYGKNEFGSIDFGFDEFHFAADAEFGGLFGKIGKFFKNAARCAGRSIAKINTGIVKGITSASSLVGKVPIVGKALSSTVNLASGPLKVTNAAIKGQRIDKAVLNNLKDQVQAVRDVAPVAQMVVGVVPGIGSGVSAALAAGVALSNGQNINQALIAAAKSAIPGGALAAAAIEVGVAAAQGKNILKATVESAMNQLPGGAKQAAQLVKGIAEGKNVVNSAIDMGLSQLPPAVKEAAKVAQAVARGKNVSQAMLETAQRNLPESIKSQVNKIPGGLSGITSLAQGKNVLGSVTALGLANLPPQAREAVTVVRKVTNGAKVPQSILAAAQQNLPKNLQQNLNKIGGIQNLAKNVRGINLLKSISKGKGPLQKVVGVLPDKMKKSMLIVQKAASGKKIPTNVLEAAQKSLPPNVLKGLQVGIALGSAKKIQKITRKNMSKVGSKHLKKIANVGKNAITSDPIFASGIKTLNNSNQKTGYALGAGIMAHSAVSEETIVDFRNKLQPEQQKGFDLALATKIGEVTSAPPKVEMNSQEAAAFYATKGMIGGDPHQKQEMMKVIANDPVAREGAREAVIEIANKRKRGLFQSIKEFFGFHGEIFGNDFY